MPHTEVPGSQRRGTGWSTKEWPSRGRSSQGQSATAQRPGHSPHSACRRNIRWVIRRSAAVVPGCVSSAAGLRRCAQHRRGQKGPAPGRHRQRPDPRPFRQIIGATKPGTADRPAYLPPLYAVYPIMPPLYTADAARIRELTVAPSPVGPSGSFCGYLRVLVRVLQAETVDSAQDCPSCGAEGPHRSLSSQGGACGSARQLGARY